VNVREHLAVPYPAAIFASVFQVPMRGAIIPSFPRPFFHRAALFAILSPAIGEGIQRELI
jgi:hypothetical protein